MNIVHLVVVETLSTLWNLEEPFAEISSFSLILGTKNLVKVGTQQVDYNIKNISALQVMSVSNMQQLTIRDINDREGIFSCLSTNKEL